MGRAIIKAEEYQLIGKESGRGVSIELSPYDMPREVEGRFDKEEGVLHIDFKYLDQEEALLKKIGDSLKMKVGKHSGKILGFEVSVTEHNIKKVELMTVQQMDEAIDNAIPDLPRFNQRANYKVVKSILDQKRGPIFASLATAGA